MINQQSGLKKLNQIINDIIVPTKFDIHPLNWQSVAPLNMTEAI
jgi:hypothetical protein